MVLRLSSYVDLKAGISMHPSHTAICTMLGVNEETLLKEIKCPQMFMPAGDDNENVKLVAFLLTTKPDDTTIFHGKSTRGKTRCGQIRGKLGWSPVGGPGGLPPG